MRVTSFDGMACSIAGALETIGDRWGFLLLRDLSFGLSRFEDFQDSTGIAPGTLTDRLKHLEAQGLVTKSAYSDRPPRSEYHLTDKGRSFWKVLFALKEWGDRWDLSGRGAPPVEAVADGKRSDLTLMVVDRKTKSVIDPARLSSRPGKGADDRVHFRFARGAERRSKNPSG